jgi:glycosyltransferase involved in cell wall biosynthesis
MIASVCVALSVKDGGPYLGESIESVLAQQDVPFELRIYDNGSTDGSLEVYQRYAGDPRVRVRFNPPGLNCFDSLNIALGESAAEWFMPWTADDVMLPGAIATKLAAAARTGAELVCAPATVIDAHGTPKHLMGTSHGDAAVVFEAPEFFRRITPLNAVVFPGVLVRSAALRDAGGFESRPLVSDWLMWMRLALRVRVAYLPEPALLYREHDANTTSTAERTGAFASEVVSALRLAYDEPALPPEWRPRLRDDLIAVLSLHATAHAERGLLRVADCSYPAYLLMLEALALDPTREAIAQQLADALVSAGLSEPWFPLSVVAVPRATTEDVGRVLRGVRRLAASEGLVARVQLAARPEDGAALVELIEQDLARHGDIDLELTLAPDPLSVAGPGDVLVAAHGDPLALEAERSCGCAVFWERMPDPGDTRTRVRAAA